MIKNLSNQSNKFLQTKLSESLTKISQLETELESERELYKYNISFNRNNIEKLENEINEIKENDNPNPSSILYIIIIIENDYLNHIKDCKQIIEWIKNHNNYISTKPYSKTITTIGIKKDKYKDLECMEYPWITSNEIILKKQCKELKNKLKNMNEICEKLMKENKEKDEIINNLKNNNT